jgi:hypothetical protein
MLITGDIASTTLSEAPMSNVLPSIDPAELEAVTGGVTSTGTDDTAVTAALQSLMSSISDLANNQGANGGQSFMQMLPMMMMMMSHHAAPPPPAPIVGPPPGDGWVRVA